MTMLTRTLWQGLNTPYTRHPLFWRTIREGGGTQFPRRNYHIDIFLERIGIIYVALVIALWVIVNRLSVSPQWDLLTVLLLLLSLPVWLVILFLLYLTAFKGTVFGALWTVRISAAIANQHTRNQIPVLAVSPPGALGASWAVCTGFLYRTGTFNRYISERRYTVIIATFIAPTFLLVRTYESEHGALLALIYAAALIASFYIDSIHSPVVASLVGVLIPTYTHGEMDTRAIALLVFLLLQAITFLTTLVTAMVVLPNLYASVNWGGVAAEASIPILSLLAFFAVREGIIIGLWQTLRLRINISPEEMGIFANRLV